MPTLSFIATRVRELTVQRDLSGLLRGASRSIARVSRSVGLRRNLTLPHTAPDARRSFSLRLASREDLSRILSLSQPGLTLPDRQAIAVRQKQADLCLGRAFVAVEAAGQPCFVQWVMSQADNTQIASFFDGRFPALRKGEALFENAFTPPTFRGLGFMPAAMSAIANTLRDEGFQMGITFVASDNIPSLNGCRRAGFEPYIVRRDISLLHGLVRRRQFETPKGSRFEKG